MSARPATPGDPGATADPGATNLDATFTVQWTHRLRLQRDVLDPGCSLLGDVISAIDDRPVRTLAVVDGGLAAADPALVQRLTTHLDAAPGGLEHAGPVLTVPGGEQAKNTSAVFDEVVGVIDERRICRRSCVLIIGGGAVLDAVGFAAAASHRGVPVVRMPSTTVSQGDSGIGVKCGINARGKKNFLGAFDAPHAVVNDASLLTTLSDRDWRCGISEAIKVALLKDAAFFDAIERDCGALVARDLDRMESVLSRSARLHFHHITEGGDPFERRSARPLDFGHWSAHKLEQMSGFELRHGEAVAIGLAIDTVYSQLIGLLDEADADRILACLRGAGFVLEHPLLARAGDLLEGLREFREHLGGELTITLLRAPGQPADVHAIDAALMTQAIERLR